MRDISLTHSGQSPVSKDQTLLRGQPAINASRPYLIHKIAVMTH